MLARITFGSYHNRKQGNPRIPAAYADRGTVSAFAEALAACFLQVAFYLSRSALVIVTYSLKLPFSHDTIHRQSPPVAFLSVVA